SEIPLPISRTNCPLQPIPSDSSFVKIICPPRLFNTERLWHQWGDCE
ncbi:2831_t:CDS:1, partial [Gigaspora rosea]